MSTSLRPDAGTHAADTDRRGGAFSRAVPGVPVHFMLLVALSALVAGISVTSATRTAPAGQSTPQHRVVSTAAVQRVGPSSPGVLAGDFLYVAGQGGRRADGTLPDTVDGQVRQAFLNVQAIVEAAGWSMAHVVYSQVYLTDMAHYEVMDRVWREFFPTAPPARAVVGVYRLPADLGVQVEAVAFRDLARRHLVVPRGEPTSRSWSPGVMAGNRLFLSASGGADPATGLIPADPDVQAQLALDDMHRTLTAAGLDFRHVVFMNPYLTTDASRRMNEIYAKHFEFGNTPARATIGVSSLPASHTIAFTGVAIADLSLRRAFKPTNMRPSPTASPCVLADDTYYCSAKGPFTPGPPPRAAGSGPLQGIWAGTIEAQVRQTLRNLLDGLEEAGFDLGDVVATNLYLDDISDLPRLDRVYTQYFPERSPARTTVAQRAPLDRTPRNDDTFPGLEQISLIAVRQTP